MSNRRDDVSSSKAALIIFGSVFSVFGGIALASAQKARKTREKLVNTPLTKLEDLQGFNSSTPVYLKVQGKISTDYPILSELAKERGAIYEKKKTGVWYSWRNKQGSESEYLADHFRRSAPFFIQDSQKKMKLFINETPTQPQLELVHQHDEPGGNFLLSLFLSTFRVHYPYKYIITESILPLDKTLLALGDVSRRTDGSLHMKPSYPSFFSLNPKPYILSLKSEDELAEELNSTVFSGAIMGSIGLSCGLACFAAALFAGRL